ncbi:hypothetical protein PMIN01_12501 [Paraphaeosphaeria minitans]|uniref:Uncharacterized protein n=1 Tax=Paraphaeosphaeria minitans TaxID=565426 RepID=A0A9P6KKB3_9PLEO|nr:hypothetical protein PMIN01_12501 [Paraphaeosphaeria minitans]
MDILADKKTGILHHAVQVIQVHEKKDLGDDIVLNANVGKVDRNLKLAPDGHTVLVPQTSDDPDDPLNWSSTEYSHDRVLGSGMEQDACQNQRDWQLERPHGKSALRGIFWIIVSSRWGRGPALFWSPFTGCVFTIACAVTRKYAV